MSRVGNFTSSEIHKLMSKGMGNFSLENVGSSFNTYIEEKIFERRLGRSLSNENNARPTAWGTLVEEKAFEKMSLDYSLVSKKRYTHQDEELKYYWNGMPDFISENLVGDIKSPYTLKSFCTLVKNMSSIDALKEEHPEYYWQLVSNAILTGVDIAKLVVYVPYLEDLQDIKEMASDGIESRFAFINWATDDELPYLIKGNHYKDLNEVTFEVPKEDKELLTQRVRMAVEIIKANILC